MHCYENASKMYMTSLNCVYRGFYVEAEGMFSWNRLLIEEHYRNPRQCFVFNRVN